MTRPTLARYVNNPSTRVPFGSDVGLLPQPFVNDRIRFARHFVFGVEDLQLHRLSAALQRFSVLSHSFRRIKLIAFGCDVEHVNVAAFVFAGLLPIAWNASADSHHTAHSARMREGVAKVHTAGLRKAH